jgi:hypothetical protein
MQPEKRPIEFVIKRRLDSAWMIYGSLDPMGPFHSREHALDLAEGMATVMRSMGDNATVRMEE